MFFSGLPAVKDLINEKTWPEIVEMIKVAGMGASSLLVNGIPTIKNFITDESWSIIKNYFLELLKYIR